MKDLKKNKLALLGIGAVIVVFSIAGLIFYQNTQKSNERDQKQPTFEEQSVEMEASDIGLTLDVNPAKTEVIMTIEDTSLFDSFEYEMNYDAEVDGELVPRGAIGSGEVEPGQTTIRREITIGTCSSGKCKYDTGVSKISFIIRLNLKDGQVGIVKSDLNLE